MTIDYSDTINELKGRIDLCACGHMDAADLIAVAGRSIDIEARAILAQPEYVHMLWGWLEGKRIEIFAKIGSRESGVGSRKSQGIKTAGSNSENSNTTPDSRLPTPDPRMIEEINSILKKGADGAAIKTSTVSLAGLASALFPVRHDLFFGKKLLFDLNLENMGPLSWKDAFFQMKKIKADGIILSSFADKIKEPAVAKAMAGKQGIKNKNLFMLYLSFIT